MDYSQALSPFGLVLNTVGSIVLIWPYLSQKHFVEDDYIKEMDQESGKYLQRKHITERKINITGFIFLAAGFIFQFISIVISG